MKIGNFGRLDPELRKQGITGLAHGSKLEEVVWDEFNGNWEKLAFDKGYITITPGFKVLVSKFFDDYSKDKSVNDFFLKYNNQNIIKPERFLPSKEFLD